MSLYRLHEWRAALLAIATACILASQPTFGADIRKAETEFLAKAADGVEKHRKVEAVVSFKDGKGQVIAGAPVQIRQITHEFLFGCIAFDLVRGGELKRRGTPISGLGIQAHEPREEWFSPEKVWTTLDRLGGLGYPLHITEYIPQSAGKPITGGWREGTWTEEAQAQFAEQFYRLCFGHPSVASINWWGLSDRRIWLPAGGLVDAEYEPKPVYNRLRDLIHHQWKTSLDVQTDAKGEVTFRGFCGAYDVSIKMPDGQARTFKAVLQRGHDNQLTFTVE